MKNLLELHSDAADEVSLLDDNEVVQYVVGDVRCSCAEGWLSSVCWLRVQ